MGMKKAEQRIIDGLNQPKSLVESCEILGDPKNFQDECEAKLKILEEAACSASQLTTLKTMFAEKQKLVADLEAYGAGHGGGAPPAPAAPAEAPAEAPVEAPAAETAAPAEETPAA